MEFIKKLKAEAQAIIDAASKNDGGIMTKEQEEQFSAITDKLEKAKAQADAVAKYNNAVSTVDSVTPVASLTKEVADVKVIKDAYQDTNGFKSHTEFLKAVQKAGSGNGVDPRLNNLMATAGSDENRITSNPDGGYLVQRTMLNNLMALDPQKLQYDTGSMTTGISLNGVVEVAARVDKTHTTSVTGGFRVYRKAETSDGSTSKGTYEKIILSPTELIGASYASEMLLALAPQAFASIVSSSFDNEFISKLNAERIRGTGAGEYLGILNSSALVTVDATSGQTADTITYANVSAMFARSYNPSQSVWMVNHDCLPQLLGMKDDDGRLIWQPSATAGVAGTLFGRPVYLDENCSTVGDVGDILFVNWSEYLEGRLGGTYADESIHVRFLANERAFRFVKYNDGKPWWTAALTPKNSAKTMSPFVTLAAR